MAMTYPDCPPAYVEVDDSHLIHPAPVAAKIISENVTTVAATEEDVSNNKMATIGLILPFPQQSSDQLQGKHAKSPFFIYHPPVARLSRPEGNDKESVVHNAKRKIQYRKDVARAGTGVASKVVKIYDKGTLATKTAGVEFVSRTPNKKNLKEICLFYPSSYPDADLRADFDRLLSTIKKSATKNSWIATSIAPFALAFDAAIMLPGSFEVCTYWARNNFVGSMRATSITKGVASEKVPLKFSATDKLYHLTTHLHEIVNDRESERRQKSSKSTRQDPQTPISMELAQIVMELLREEAGEDLIMYDTDLVRVAEDIESMMQKAAKEWVK